MNTANYFTRAGVLYGARPALVDEHGVVTHEEIAARVHRVANALAALGLRPGDRVAGILGNRREYIEVRYGALKGSFVYVRLNARSTPKQNAVLIADAGARALFVDAPLVPQLPVITARAAQLERIIVVGGGAPGALEHDALVDDASDAEPDVLAGGEALATINYTSGTTAEPKGGMLAHRAWYMRTRNFFSVLDPLSPDDVMLHVTPLSHASSIFLELYAIAGARQVLLRSTETEAILDAIERYRVTRVFLVPTLIYRLVESPLVGRYDVRSLRAVHYGGSPISPVRLAEAMRQFGAIFEQFYGSVEALPPLAFFSRADHAAALAERGAAGLASAGRSHPHLDIRLVDEHGCQVKRGEVGEIVTRGDHTMLGYWKRPDATAAKVKQGWVYTGDVGRIGDDGRLYIVDRRNDVVISGGFNVYPSEVEAVLVRHPAVAEAAVVGLPDEQWGETVTAFVVLRSGAAAEAEEIRHWARTRLGAHQAPKAVHVVTALPKSAYGKILRRDLREPFWVTRARRVN